MKKLLVAGIAAAAICGASALAADMPVKAPVYKAPEALYDWTGLYVGVYSGVGAQQSRGRDPTGALAGTVDHTGAGFTGGGTIGYNWQFNRNWVVGVEGDFGYLGLSHFVQDYADGFFYNSKTSWIGTLRGRAGYSNGPTLNYITAGGAWVHTDDSSLVGTTVSSSKTLGGYTIGTGVETMLGGNWTAKAETFFVDVGHGATVANGAFNLQNDKNRFQGMKFGLNYLFGGKQPVLMAHNWSGFYAGIVGGTAVTESRGTDPTGATVGQIGNNGDGFTVGGMAGYNWQFAPQLVAGIEGDFSYLGIDHSNANYNNGGGANPAAVLGVKTSWLGTLRGRVGYSTGPALLYVTGGAAWVDLKDQWAFTTPTSSSTTKSGATIGGGIETVISGNWTSKTEYLYIDAGHGNTLVSAGSPMQVDHKFHVFRSALIYKFGSQ
jgi:outer membrane immunogenic protein